MILITADDYGISLNYSERVLELISDELVNSVSVIVNVDNIGFLARNLYPYKNSVSINCHLNIVEGKSISLNQNSHLINSNGYFYRDIKKLYFFYMISGRHRQKQIREDIRQEFVAQLSLFKDLFPDIPISVDSHQHVHLLPFIHPILTEIGERFSCSSVRLGVSKTSISRISLRIFLRSMIFNWFAQSARKQVSLPLRSNVVLGVNEMNNWTLRMFDKIFKKVESNTTIDFELVSHPAWKECHEISYMDPQTSFSKHYTSASRHVEHNLIKEFKFGSLLKRVI